MKHTYGNKSDHFSIRDEQEAMVKAHMRCQICNAPGKLKCHSRTRWHRGNELSDLLVLCENCYQLAQIRKRNSRQSRALCLLLSVCCVFLYAYIALIVFTLARLLPTPLLALASSGIYAALLLKMLSRHWL